jgi:hypothetical protein
MRKHIILFFSALLFLSACKLDKTPDGIIKQDKMISLLTDIHLVDGSLYNVPSSNPDSMYKYGNGNFVVLFKKYNIDSTQFKKSLKYYSFRPEQLDKMYTQILKNLQDKVDSINKVPLKIVKPTTHKNAVPK